MKVALQELRRRPWRFAPAIIALVLLTGLLLTLGGLLDGLYNGFTGGLRAQPGALLTYASDANLSVIRSRIDPATTAQVERVPGVEQVGGLGTVLLGAKVPGQATEASVALFGYQRAPRGVPAPPEKTGQVYADTSLKAYGVKQGQTLLLGPQRNPVSVVGWVSDTNFLLQGGLWGALDTWREVLGSARPDQVLAPGTYQVLTVSTTAGAALAPNTAEASASPTASTLKTALRLLITRAPLDNAHNDRVDDHCRRKVCLGFPLFYLIREGKVALEVVARWAGLRYKGAGPVFVKVMRRVYYRRRDVEAWLNDNRMIRTDRPAS